jgi:hypothetical protein
MNNRNSATAIIKTDFNACDTKKEMIATGRAINGLNGKSKNVPG